MTVRRYATRARCCCVLMNSLLPMTFHEGRCSQFTDQPGDTFCRWCVDRHRAMPNPAGVLSVHTLWEHT